ncbi:MAG TPA: transcriptional repressor LexA [Peptococcaceae bacterium]|jgi:repressor LexA|nr:transcriptional repressor LexA [Clostridia bacterium]HOB81848.1 transcriptional repressor LexA [Peptococcaceae bacterium]HPZ71478.1 transcriptional repressor LexA [Peptococcaceae bacterium]HQD53816.1 transcriptional repressor LexA [Peptococcaceae bacterium]
MTQPLTERQKEILAFIKKELKSKGYPPAVREIGKAVGLSSSSTVHNHLNQLEKKGYIKRDPTKPRAIEVLDDVRVTKEMVNVPVVGKVTAGMPILAVENIEDTFPLPFEFTRSDEVFMLNVSGDSMINCGILDGDMVIVRKQPIAQNGDIVVALIEDEATVKRFYRTSDYVRLVPENKSYEPIIVRDLEQFQILGKVIGLIRRL